MSSDNEISIPVETNPRFKFERELSQSTNIFSLEYGPQVGLLSPNPKALLLPGMALQLFNPSSLEHLNRANVGDLIQISCDPNHEYYKAWNPPEIYRVEEGFSRMYRIRFVEMDCMGFPNIVADEAI
jgi:hypothetical protein